LTVRFYKAMGENALYLDLVAKELSQNGTAKPEEIILRVTDDPDNIFYLSTSRLKRHAADWREVLKPLLGVLLVAREPLTERNLRAILNLDDERLREGIARLGGLIDNNGRNRYTLFHLKLYDYLRQDESNPLKEYIFARDEEEGWHDALAQWCERGDLSTIWEDARYDPAEQGRREYARKHYATHLYTARSWQRLFEVLDTVQYGQAKIHDDPSTRSYALDLDLGRQATMWEGWTNEEGMNLLPRLWKYSLLRCGLTSRADRYPEKAFRLLVLLRKKQEALGLAELLTDLAKKVRVLLLIAEQLREQRSQESEWLEILMRASEVAPMIQSGSQQAGALRDLGMTLAQAEQWTEAERAIGTMQSSSQQARALGDLGMALSQARQWTEAERVIGTIQNNSVQSLALIAHGTTLAQAEQWEHASQVWTEAEHVISTMQSSYREAEAWRVLGTAFAQAQQWIEAERPISTIQAYSQQAWTLRELSTAFAQAEQWAEAERVIGTIQNGSRQAEALLELGTALAQAQLWEHASQVWTEAERVIGTIQTYSQQAEALRELGTTFAQAQLWTEAERVIGIIQDGSRQARALRELGTALVQAQLWDHASQVWAEAERVIGTIQNGSRQVWALRELGIAFAQTGQWDHASQVWAEAERVIGTIQTYSQQAEALRDLATEMASAAEFERLLHLIQRSWRQVEKREEALTLFSMASSIISFKPKVGISFFDAFTWVEQFLGQ
jgi:tetratricopeptide (TPR) repeat protein